MANMIDIIGSMVLGGMILLLTLIVTDVNTRNFMNYNADAIVQSNLTHTAHLIEDDLRKMGYGIPEADQSTIIQIGTASHLKYLSQLNLNFKYWPGSGIDDIPDTIEYQIILADTISFQDTTIYLYNVKKTVKITPNYNKTALLGRISNSDVFRYLDQVGHEVSVILAARMVEVTLVSLNQDIVLSPELVSKELKGIENEEFRKQELLRLLRPSFWRQTRLVSQNLRR